MKTASLLDRAMREVHRGRLSPIALMQTLLRAFNEAGVVGLGTLAYQNDPLSLAMGGTAATTAAGARTSLGLGTVAVENTPLAVAKGGTGVATSTGATNAVLSDSPTIVTPTIASFANATHAHQSAAGGGSLDAAAIGTGTVPTARLGSGAASSSTFLRGDSSWAAVGSPASGTVRKTTTFTTTSASFVDVTDLSITITTGANRVLLLWLGVMDNDAPSGGFATFNVDAADVGDATNGLAQLYGSVAAVCLMYLTDVLTAASHTFKCRMKSNAAATSSLAAASMDSIFSATEIA